MTPIFIISFNRLTALKKLIDRLVEMNQDKIIVVDNGSTYGPILQYYEEAHDRFALIKMERNYGHNVMREIFNSYGLKLMYRLDLKNFIYTDCDIVPVEECPPDFAQKFNEVLRKYPSIEKIGFGLKIDDIPDSFRSKPNVVKVMETYCRESEKIHDTEIGIDLYPVPIDTTFACRRANTNPGWSKHCFRTGAPYLARHLSWYIDSEHLSDEDQYYMATAGEKETHFPHRWGLEHALK